MKRLYVTLSFILALLLWAITGLGQKNINPSPVDPAQDFQRRMQLREEMHRQMMDKLLHGKDMDEDFFRDMDLFLEEALGDAFKDHNQLWQRNFKSGNTVAGPVKTSWSQTRTARVLTVTPAHTGQELDINVQGGMITIKGKSAEGNSVSSFSNSFSVPQDTDPAGVKISQQDGKIVIELPFRQTPTTPSEERKPLRPGQDSEIQI